MGGNQSSHTVGLKEDGKGKEGKVTHHSCATARGAGGTADSALLQQGQASWASENAGLQRRSPSRRKSKTIWGAKAVLGIACCKARRGGFGMKMAFTHSTRWLLRAKPVVLEQSFSSVCEQ